ncbi:MAG: hypothetical protein EP330_27380 [Deltaproteobacteria bacterium]|nr:MAG: hypothetical protein EP330_27380 [Deltaproteobacteria bacterium]
MDGSCCANPVADWTVTIEGEQFREVIRCGSCGTLHANEVIPAPIRWAPQNCAHCGGLMEQDTWRDGAPMVMRCETCELTKQECIDMHRRLATAENGQPGLLVGAVRSLQSGKAVLAIKLATAAAMSGDDPSYARFIRLKAMASGGLTDHALDEAWRWIDEGEDELPAELFDWLAAAEAETGNVPGIRRALETGLRVNPENTAAWTDYGELMLALEEYQKALQAARYGLTNPDPELSERNLAVILEIAEGMYGRELYAEALSAVGHAGDHHMETHVELAWLRARIAAMKNDVETSRQWLQLVLSLEPGHAEAQAAWDKVKPEKRRGWFGFGGGNS